MSTDVIVSPDLLETLGIFYRNAQAELLTRMAVFGYKNVTINMEPSTEPNIIKVDDGSFFIASFRNAGSTDGVTHIDLELTRS